MGVSSWRIFPAYISFCPDTGKLSLPLSASIFSFKAFTWGQRQESFTKTIINHIHHYSLLMFYKPVYALGKMGLSFLTLVVNSLPSTCSIKTGSNVSDRLGQCRCCEYIHFSHSMTVLTIVKTCTITRVVPTVSNDSNRTDWAAQSNVARAAVWVMWTC